MNITLICAVIGAIGDLTLLCAEYRVVASKFRSTSWIESVLKGRVILSFLVFNYHIIYHIPCTGPPRARREHSNSSTITVFCISHISRPFHRAPLYRHKPPFPPTRFVASCSLYILNSSVSNALADKMAKREKSSNRRGIGLIARRVSWNFQMSLSNAMLEGYRKTAARWMFRRNCGWCSKLRTERDPESLKGERWQMANLGGVNGAKYNAAVRHGRQWWMLHFQAGIWTADNHVSKLQSQAGTNAFPYPWFRSGPIGIFIFKKRTEHSIDPPSSMGFCCGMSLLVLFSGRFLLPWRWASQSVCVCQTVIKPQSPGLDYCYIFLASARYFNKADLLTLCGVFVQSLSNSPLQILAVLSEYSSFWVTSVKLKNTYTCWIRTKDRTLRTLIQDQERQVLI